MVDCSLNQSMNLQTNLISIVDGQSLKVFEIWYACMKFDSSKSHFLMQPCFLIILPARNMKQKPQNWVRAGRAGHFWFKKI